MATRFARLRAELLPQRVTVLVVVWRQVGFPIVGVSVQMNARRIIAKGPRSAIDRVDPAVRSRHGKRILHHDCSPAGRLDKRRVDISADIFLLTPRVVGRQRVAARLKACSRELIDTR